MNTTPINQSEELAAVRRQLEEATVKLRELEAKQKQEASKPWEPPGGGFYITSINDIGLGETANSYRLVGSEYPTEEAAKSALPYIVFFKRLCCLAQSLNPSGKVGGNFYVTRFHERSTGWAGNERFNTKDVTCVFETEEAAKKAAEIMNRDQWKLP